MQKGTHYEETCLHNNIKLKITKVRAKVAFIKILGKTLLKCFKYMSQSIYFQDTIIQTF